MTTSAEAESCTTGIYAMEVQLKEKKTQRANRKVKTSDSMTLLDTAGQEDTRSIEQSIAGQKAIDVAINNCNSVVPIIVLSSNFGDKMITVKKVAKFLDGMFTNLDNLEDNTLQFLITKCDIENFGEMKGKIENFMNKLTDEDTDNESLMCILDNLQDSLEDLGEDICVNPLDENQREKILKRLKDAKTISDPPEFFKM